MKSFLLHLLRSALLGFLALYSIGGLMLAAEAEKRAQSPVEAVEPRPVDLGPLGVLSAAGALTGATTALLLLFFPVGPLAKPLVGVFCGPFLPMLVWLPEALRQGRGGDAAAAVLLGALVGLLVGVLDGARVRRRREG